MSLTLSDFSYDLPHERIAHSPASPRDSSKLLVLDRQTGALKHHIFRELPQLLQPGDVIVRNNTKVIPARIFGKKPSGGVVEVLLNKIQPPTKLHSLSTENTATTTDPSEEVWECLTKPGLKPGQTIEFSADLTARCLGFGSDTYTRLLAFSKNGVRLLETLTSIGELPLPPYISTPLSKAETADRYQTTFAKSAGSVAAPTAGLHFTPELDIALRKKGIKIIELTLHVGLGTFLPVKTEHIAEHHMHAETFSLSEETATTLNTAKQAGRRIIAVGTTSVRTLESCVSESGLLQAQNSDTEIFIYPPCRYHFVDGIITNFHLPESTLLMLVSAFVSEPNTSQPFTNFSESSIGKAYVEAIAHEYRFFSFGDAMLIV
jgi:S-adenosylmethionine:tRNA ribosyltransferase-isomerase